MKVNGSADWTSALFFAEVKEIFRRKFYFCSPLELYENGMKIIVLVSWSLIDVQ
jgi:hypothetical protein